MGQARKAKEYLQFGIGIDSYSRWKAIGVTNLYENKSLKQAGLSYEDAKLWSEIGVSSREWLDYIKIGINYNEAKEWSEIGVTRLREIKMLTKADIDLQSAKLWSESGLDVYPWREWKQAGFSSEDAKFWRGIGVKRWREVKKFNEAGIFKVEAENWYNSKLKKDNWYQWLSAGITPQEAKGWLSIGVGWLSLVNRFKQSGINLSEAIAWSQIGVTTYTEIDRLKAEGITTPAEKKGWDSVGVKKKSEWIKNGFSWEEVREWKRQGFDSVDEVGAWKAEGFDPSTAKTQKIRIIQRQNEQQELNEKQAAERAAKLARDEKVEYVIKIIIFLIFLTVVGAGIYFGVTDRAIFYMDTGDLLLSFTPYAILFISVLLSEFAWDWGVYAGLALSALVMSWIVYKSFKFNHDFLPSISTALAKLVLSFVYLANILRTASPSGESKSERRRNKKSALILLALLTPLVYKLVNGERVLARRRVQEKNYRSKNETRATPARNKKTLTITCPSCSAKYSIPYEKVPAKVAKAKCKKCGGIIAIMPIKP